MRALKLFRIIVLIDEIQIILSEVSFQRTASILLWSYSSRIVGKKSMGLMVVINCFYF